jgi:hypothetical protein
VEKIILMIVTKYSSIKEIREWLDFYGVDYKRNERKASLVKKMEKVREVFGDMGEKEYQNSLLSPEDIRRSKQINDLLNFLAIQSGMATEYLDMIGEQNNTPTKTVKDVTGTYTVSDSNIVPETYPEIKFVSEDDEDDKSSEFIKEESLSTDVDSDEVLPVNNTDENILTETISEVNSVEDISTNKWVFVVLFVIAVLTILAVGGYFLKLAFG